MSLVVLELLTMQRVAVCCLILKSGLEPCLSLSLSLSLLVSSQFHGVVPSSERRQRKLAVTKKWRFSGPMFLQIFVVDLVCRTQICVRPLSYALVCTIQVFCMDVRHCSSVLQSGEKHEVCM
jgi:hypothetical protein